MNISDYVRNNREKIKRIKDNPKDEVNINVPTTEITTQKNKIKLQTTTKKKIIDTSDGSTISTETIASNKIGTLQANKIIIDALLGNNSDTAQKHIFGTGNKTDRRNSNSLQNKLTTLNTNNNTSINNNTININTTITNLDSVSVSSKDISEIGINTNNNNLLQYLND